VVERPTVAPTAAPATVAEASTADEPERAVHHQLVSVLRPLHAQRDGSYSLSLELQPAELGRVQLEVTVRNGEIGLHLVADRASTDQLLRGTVAQLRAELESAGFRAGHVGVGGSQTQAGGGGTGPGTGRNAPNGGTGRDVPTTDTRTPTPRAAATAAGSDSLDVRI
jgi:flagellar hook-length control protein FliK